MKRVLLFLMVPLLAATMLSAANPPCEAKVYSKDKFVRFKKFTNVYIQEDAAVQFFSIPEEFEGYKVTVRGLDSSDPVRFRVQQAGMVRIVAAGRPVNRLISEGWVEINKITLITPNGEVLTDPIYIFEKRLNVGEHVIPSEGTFGIRLLKK